MTEQGKDALRMGRSAALCKRAISLVQHGRREEALTVFREAVTADPTYALAWADMGTCLMELERYKEAAEAFEGAHERFEGDFATWFQLAKAYAQMERADKAGDALKKARRLRPSDPELLKLEREIGVRPSKGKGLRRFLARLPLA